MAWQLTSFWPLIWEVRVRIVYDSQSNLEAKVNSVFRNGDQWCWKPARSDDLVDIQSRLPKIQLGDEDKPVWTISWKGVFVSSNTWDFMRKMKQEVRWWPIVWFPQAIPKQAFILFLAVLNRLSTRERVVAWGVQGDY
jgi:hypothetical protein